MRNMKFTRTIAVLAICVICQNAASRPVGKGYQYIDNGKICLGIDMDRGGSIFSFALSKDGANMLNHHDEGRFVQQSYYGESDGSRWWGQNWSWNPIQGGGSDGSRAEVKSAYMTRRSFHVVSTPRHWATGRSMTELEMEETITLKGRVCHIHYTFRNTGEGASDHPESHQEMPAVFVDATYDRLVSYKGNRPWTGDSLTYKVPGWPNEYHERTEEWSAFVNGDGYGIGVYTPGTASITAYRYGKGNDPGPEGDDCSYFAPLRTFAVSKGMVMEYDVYMVIGHIEDIRARFYDIHRKLSRNP